MDISMPPMDGLEATRQILKDLPYSRVLTLSSHDNPMYIRDALEAGAKGYVVKDAIASELIEAMRSLYHGRRYFSHQIADVVNQYIDEVS
jgi:DNA-binding NarL/FixJ family response regulator